MQMTVEMEPTFLSGQRLAASPCISVFYVSVVDVDEGSIPSFATDGAAS